MHDEVKQPIMNIFSLCLTQPTAMNIIIMLLCLCFCNISPLIFSNAADFISANQTLSGNETIISSGGKFELGFFSPGNSSNYYIGIWYKSVSKQTVVWVLNRGAPISDHISAELKVLDGDLVLLDENRTKIWSTYLPSPDPTKFNSVIALLLDNGNLVLREGSQNLWESFDNPTDTWMPGGKIRYNKDKGSIVLNSWKNSEDPSRGLFTFLFDPGEHQFVMIWNGPNVYVDVKYWNSGIWDGNSFSLIPEMRTNYYFNYSYVDTENETYLTYSLNNQSVFSRFVMDVSGQIKLFSLVNNTEWNLVWSHPRSLCDVYVYCGAFGICDSNSNSSVSCSCLPGFEPNSGYDWHLKNYSGGCVREIDLPCESNKIANSNGGKDEFVMITTLSLPKYNFQTINGSISECELFCLSDCSCTAYTYARNECRTWYGELFNLRKPVQGNDLKGNTIYIRLSASSSLPHHEKKNIVIGAIVGSCVAVLVLLMIGLFVTYTRQKRKVGDSKATDGFLVAFGYKDLQNATKNFSTKLGGGGFGSVFKGTLPDSTIIAVKKLESISQGEKQFRAEVGTIGMIQHVNLVRLRGFCVEGNKKLLVYDYMENGSLDSHLFKESKALKWKTRYQIALGVARGLAYLHENCRDCIIHCDIKPENVLLDAEFCPKVADFGLAKLVGRDFSRALTTMRGTLGYLAPEWISGVAITAKADVYSYGIMLFELVSGNRNWTHSEDENARYFPCLAASVIIEGGNVLALLDRALEGDADEKELTKICKVACWCVQGDESIRPSMSQVVQIFEGVIDVNLPPFPRWLQVLVDESPEISSTN